MEYYKHSQYNEWLCNYGSNYHSSEQVLAENMGSGREFDSRKVDAREVDYRRSTVLAGYLQGNKIIILKKPLQVKSF